MPLVAVVVAALAACGGGGGGDETEVVATTEDTVVTVTTPEDTAQAEATPSGKPTFTITLKGESRSATVGAPWTYSVQARSRDGDPAGGTAKMHVFLGTARVNTLGWFSFNGKLTKQHMWPSVLRGKKVVLQAEVEGDGGTQRANWPVTVE